MITREQIEAVRDDVECAKPTECEVCEPIHAALDMALAYLDSTRARRVGEAVLELGEYVPFMIECAIGTIEDGAGFDDDVLPRIRAFRATINAALRGEP